MTKFRRRRSLEKSDVLDWKEPGVIGSVTVTVYDTRGRRGGTKNHLLGVEDPPDFRPSPVSDRMRDIQSCGSDLKYEYFIIS